VDRNLYPPELADLMAAHTNKLDRTLLAENNASERGGAIACIACHVSILHQVYILNNTANITAGGVYASQGE
jgi:predicted outer membrane repeat protein